ncbi:MAG: hypothetical protein JWM34_4366 [Ilumatobacteraceae bacterium]|nr:hypothetical protein [Ilumatobacteraceae bacterium]
MTAARRFFAALAAAGSLFAGTALASCASSSGQSADTTAPVGTVGAVGVLPETTAPDTAVVAESKPVTTDSVVTTDPAATTTTITETTVPVDQTLGSKSAGNRLLMIGDSVTASISTRYGGEACSVLVPRGWKVEVDAETGKFIDFGKLVLDKRLSAGWDAAVLFLGNNYGYDKATYQQALHALLLRLVPRPTLLIDTSMFRPQQQDVNDAIHEEAAQFTSVTVLDWTTISQDPALTGADNLHLTETGRNTLAFYIGAAMGQAPTQPGQCLKTNFTDDSAGSPDGPPGNQTTPKTTVPHTTPTTVKATETTVKGTGTGTTTTVKSTGTGTTTATTSPTNTSSTIKGTGTTTATTAPTSSSTATTAPTSTSTAPTPATTAAPPIITLPPVTTAAPTTAAPTTAAPSPPAT